jgi:hypothetical protein
LSFEYVSGSQGAGGAGYSYRISIQAEQLFKKNQDYRTKVNSYFESALKEAGTQLRNKIKEKISSTYKDHRIFNRLVHVSTDRGLIRHKGSLHREHGLNTFAGIDVSVDARKSGLSKRWNGAFYTAEHGETPGGDKTIKPRGGNKYLAVPLGAAKIKFRNAPINTSALSIFPDARWEPRGQKRFLVRGSRKNPEYLAVAKESVPVGKAKNVLRDALNGAISALPRELNKVASAHGVRLRLGRQDAFTVHNMGIFGDAHFRNTVWSELDNR